MSSVRITAIFFRRSVELQVRAGRFGRGPLLWSRQGRVMGMSDVQAAVDWSYAVGHEVFLDNSAADLLPGFAGEDIVRKDAVMV